MSKVLESFLQKQRVGVLASQLSNGNPHTAVVDFACVLDPFAIVIQTDVSSKKCEMLIKFGACSASFVTGFEEEKSRTAQLDGVLSLDCSPHYVESYFEKFPTKESQYENDIFLLFTPTWWRYTDWRNSPSTTILCSDRVETARFMSF